MLVTAFEPFKDYSENITEKVLKILPESKNLVKRLLPVRFEKKIFIDVIKNTSPDIVIALGQYPRGKKIRIERKAVNLKRDNKEDVPQKITNNGVDILFTSLKLKDDSMSRITYDSGMYVCNFSMYTSLEFLNSSNIKYCFLHIPKDNDVALTRDWLLDKIHEIKEGLV